MKKIEKSIDLGGRKLTLSTGLLAEQATSAVMAQYGDTVLLATVVAAPLKMDPGYFPLMVEYQERLYAGGRIKGSRWVKREGRPTDEEILAARLIDRSIRPLFPKNYKKDVQVIVTVLSVDIENDPKILAGVAVSAALAVSSIPWDGPVGTLKVGMKDGSYFTNPLDSELKFSDLDLVVSSTKKAVLMIEAGAKEIDEAKILEGIEYAQKEAEKIIDLIEDMAKEMGNQKEAVAKEKYSSELKSQIKKIAAEKMPQIIKSMLVSEGGRSKDFEELVSAVNASLDEKEKPYVFEILEDLKKEYVREQTLAGKRLDGRKLTQIRPLSAMVGILPRTHGSAIFQRGQTQVLSVATLGAPSLGQLIETAEGEESKRYMHHYSFPPYSVGETGRVGYPNRREIGHGALAERALEPVIPNEDVFPYTIRVVSEVMSSNGSTSMASVCGSTLSMMDAGVPLTSPVSGIAMGLMFENDKHVVLTDIIGMEDFNGDMDFKVAGTTKGITALQLDVKTLSLTSKILGEALEQSKVARAEILEVITKTLSAPRTAVSTYAPKIKVIKVDPAKIGEVIGPGGKTIRKIIADTGAQVEVEDDGSVNISGLSEDAVNKAVETVEGLTKEVQPGEIYEGEVKRIQPFGAFVQILPGKDGLVHVSDMSTEFVKDPNDIVQIGQKVTVRVKEVDEMRRINLSMLLDPSLDKPKEERRGSDGDRGGSRGGYGRENRDFGPRRFDSRGSSGRRFSSDRRFGGDRPRSSGPHFPTSRLMEKKDFGR